MSTTRIHLDPKKLTKDAFDQLLMAKYDIFYRRIVEYISNDINGIEDQEVLAILIDDNNNEYDMFLPKDGYTKSLSKALEYFILIEEYETCSLIKDMIKQIKE